MFYGLFVLNFIAFFTHSKRAREAQEIHVFVVHAVVSLSGRRADDPRSVWSFDN